MREVHARSSQFAFVLLALVLSACAQEQAPNSEPVPEIVVAEPAEAPSDVEADTVVTTDRAFYPSFDLFVADGDGSNDAHGPYRSEIPEIAPFSSPNLPDAPFYALVATDRAVIHRSGRISVRSSADSYMPPVATIDSQTEPVAIGTVLPIYEVYETRLDTNLVAYDGEFNYFYRTAYNGQTGLIFGADLYPGPGPASDADEFSALRRSPDVLQRYSYYYAVPRRAPEWVAINGLRSYSDEALARLVRDRFFYEQVSADEYRLAADRPSDMISLYLEARSDRARTMYLTSDLFAHSIHLLFHTALKTVEEFEFAPQLRRFLELYIADLSGDGETEDFPEYRDARQLAIEYLQVALALLQIAPTRNFETFPETYDDVDVETVLAGFPDRVRQEVQLIVSAGGFADSPILEITEDYSQYRARGHYTENGVLTAYFRAMMWFGRAHFPISASSERVLDQSESALEATVRLLPTVLVLQSVLRENEELSSRWRDLFDPITTLIGRSDDISFYDLESIADEVSWDDLPVWLADGDNVSRYAARAHSELRSPAIAGNSVLRSLSEAPADSESAPTPPRGFRLFGQRFTYDSFVHQLVSAPRLIGRPLVAGTDLFDALGRRAARQAADTSSETYAFEDFTTTIDRLRAVFDTNDPAFYLDSYYNAHLALLRTLASFESGAGIFFTESLAWDLRALTAAHGSWAELRHDTLLYVKQVYAEMGGDDVGPTYRTVNFERPTHYIEPNRDFFVAAINLLRLLAAQDVVRSVEFDIGPQIRRFEELCRTALVIVEKQLADRPIAPEENEFILSVAEQLVPIVTGAFATPFGSVPPEEYRRAVIADVFTNAEVGVALEIATGIPYRIHVLLNDGTGGRRIATGYGYSYYEFYQPIQRRMTNEEWREIAYTTIPERYLPSWATDIALPAGTTTVLVDE